ncbi:hypothetical protein BDZ94DRAFT_412752 [Collybia nuda]|uniref:Uncharacterized protein n=1 Tax=Collybia nuda TaxID=64659 RepID=A0A9P6CLR0_9AGAR|nr:hypothetical protein BDZ94DRAFT_412752 [Collybia nuda]
MSRARLFITPVIDNPGRRPSTNISVLLYHLGMIKSAKHRSLVRCMEALFSVSLGPTQGSDFYEERR